MAETTCTKQQALQSEYATRDHGNTKKLTVPQLAYRPVRPKWYRPRIGLIACGGITKVHLSAYENAGYDVVAFADPVIENALDKRDTYYPNADVYDHADAIFKRDDIDVVDIAAHPVHRATLLEQAILAGKHVLSQKPFVLDLDFGEHLVALADQHHVKLAVNQNARWAPNQSWMRCAIEQNMLGTISSVDSHVAWDHTWVKGKPFEQIPHLILYDFAIHWFDMLQSFMPNQQPLEVMASVTSTQNQCIRPPLLAQVMVQYESAQATLIFRADTNAGKSARTLVIGNRGTLCSDGSDVNEQNVQFASQEGIATPKLQGAWFPDGMDGTMSELLCAIEDDRQPANNASDNLKALAICFAAIESAESGTPQKVGTVRRLKESWLKYLA
ncbi:MAG TPA: gfo/Idh/MocA family oxidoreductase [Phycisphaerales bacterium]|nr:gfo/Idh/MocA family oxidoreductase [Phycisphaerales bacterium]HCD34080.1 gfo/Idh/MocA family oxidoreductase [Phycisphaerales bacterium]|tara:strand:+ start:1494 stop:2651 length:1158 start_codon:yes stop_codon:yes gene_type:complete